MTDSLGYQTGDFPNVEDRITLQRAGLLDRTGRIAPTVQPDSNEPPVKVKLDETPTAIQIYGEERMIPSYVNTYIHTLLDEIEQLHGDIAKLRGRVDG